MPDKRCPKLIILKQGVPIFILKVKVPCNSIKGDFDVMIDCTKHQNFRVCQVKCVSFFRYHKRRCVTSDCWL